MKKYTVEYPDNVGYLEVSIDHEKADPHIKDMVKFWSNWGYRLDENNGDYTKTFLKSLGLEVFVNALHSRLGTNGILSHFDNQEGYCSMRGDYGIEITFADTPEYYPSDFEVTEL